MIKMFCGPRYQIPVGLVSFLDGSYSASVLYLAILETSEYGEPLLYEDCEREFFLNRVQIARLLVYLQKKNAIQIENESVDGFYAVPVKSVLETFVNESYTSNTINRSTNLLHGYLYCINTTGTTTNTNNKKRKSVYSTDPGNTINKEKRIKNNGELEKSQEGLPLFESLDSVQSGQTTTPTVERGAEPSLDLLTASVLGAMGVSNTRIPPSDLKRLKRSMEILAGYGIKPKDVKPLFEFAKSRDYGDFKTGIFNLHVRALEYLSSQSQEVWEPVTDYPMYEYLRVAKGVINRMPWNEEMLQRYIEKGWVRKA